jgi:hypothetical protein
VGGKGDAAASGGSDAQGGGRADGRLAGAVGGPPLLPRSLAAPVPRSPPLWVPHGAGAALRADNWSSHSWLPAPSAPPHSPGILLERTREGGRQLHARIAAAPLSKLAARRRQTLDGVLWRRHAASSGAGAGGGQARISQGALQLRAMVPALASALISQHAPLGAGAGGNASLPHTHHTTLLESYRSCTTQLTQLSSAGGAGRAG